MFSFKDRLLDKMCRGAFVLSFFLAFQLVYAAPVPLSNAELDRVSAGYVDLEVQAKAIATGPNAVSRFSANVEQVIGDAQADNYIYTTTTGLAEAFAKGRRVYTEVGYFFQTDEEVLSFEVVHKSSSRTGRAKSGKNKRNNNKKNKHGNKKKNSNKKKKRKKHAAKSNAKNNKKKKNHRKGKNKKVKKRSGKKKVKRERQQLYITVVTRRRVE